MKKSPEFTTHSLFSFFSFFLIHVISGSSNDPIEFHVGVVLDNGTLVERTGRTSISIAESDFYDQHRNYTTRLVLHYADSGNTTIGAEEVVMELLKKKKVQAIIGPQQSSQALFISNLGNATRVPVLSFSATSPSLTSSHIPYFIRTASNDSSQVDAIASIVKGFGWKKVVVIYEDTIHGTGIVPYLIDALLKVDTWVPYRSVLSLKATDDQILVELYKLMTMQTRVFIVHMSAGLGSRLFLNAKNVGMMGIGCVWIMTDSLTSILESKDSLPIDSMRGVLGVRHFIDRNSTKVKDFNRRWVDELKNSSLDKPSIYAFWSYDTFWLLAQAVEDVADDITNLKTSNNSITNTVDGMTISEVGPYLHDAILKSTTELVGLSGKFTIQDNQLQSSTFEIINVDGISGQVIGYWSPSYGLVSKNKSKTYSSSMVDLDTILWPVPSGWVIPTKDKRLRIGVPVANGPFIKVERNRVTNKTMVVGYSIDVFEAVLKVLPYAISYDYISFENATGQMAGSYNDFVDQVYKQEYDAVVGDITITSNRSVKVDFTLPFTESGIAMIVPFKEERNNKDAWIFWMPLTKQLWLVILGFFAYTGSVICIIEPRSNEAFKGTISDRIGTIFYFIFSTLVFAHRDRLKSNLSRVVVIVWVFVLLVLISSYTANLTSIFTVVKLQPLVEDMNELVKRGDNVGYPKGSFVKNLLEKTFDESKLKPLDKPKDYAEALTKGSSNGGVTVIFHEIPYIKIFLRQHCNEYMMSSPTHTTAGLAFGFPKGSVLNRDISRAILNVTGGDTIIGIEKKWFGYSCQKKAEHVGAQSLSLTSFWVLYLMTGATTFAAILLSVAFFIYNKRETLKTLYMHQPTMQRGMSLAKHFFEGDPKGDGENSSDIEDSVKSGGSQASLCNSRHGKFVPSNEGSASGDPGSPPCSEILVVETR